MALGIDYAFSPHPPLSAVRAGGVRFAARYTSDLAINDRNGKNLLPGEKTALLSAGMSIVFNYESSANRMLGGAPAGKADAQHADAVAKALGMPGIPVYFSCDFDATPGNQVPINAYLKAAAAIISLDRVGIYGGYWPVSRAGAAKVATWFWQTTAWSSARNPQTGEITILWYPHAHIHQAGSITLGGVRVDIDTSEAADFGQWPRPAKPRPVPAPVPKPQPAPAHAPVRRLAPGGQSWQQIAAARGGNALNIFKLTQASLTADDMAVELAMPLANGQVYYTEN